MELIKGNCVDYMLTLMPDSVDSIVTDPPYGIAYGGEGWDTFKSNVQFGEWTRSWGESAMHCLKPGGYALSFCSANMYHRMLVGLEDAGFRVLSTIMWLQRYTMGERQPSIGRQVDALRHGRKGRSIKDVPEHPDGDPFRRYGTKISVRYEPICVVQKPLDGTRAENALRHGCGFVRQEEAKAMMPRREEGPGSPGTVAMDPDFALELEEHCGEGRSRMFMICGPSTRMLGDKELGLEEFSETRGSAYGVAGKGTRRKNLHPTVKPVILIRYLQRLFTPPGGTTLDPFMGSGSHGIAAALEGLDFIGMEQEGKYIEIARARIEYAQANRDRFHLDAMAWRPEREATDRDLV